MSEKRRRRSGSGGDDGGSSPAKKAGVIAGWVLGVFLAANLAFAMFRTDETGRPNSLLSEEAVVAAAFWIPVAAIAIAAGVGAFAAWRAWQRSERAASLWLLRAFVVSLVLCIAITACALERAVDRRWFTVCAVVALAVQTILFAIATTRESRHHGASQRSGPSGAPGSRAPGSAASGDFARDSSGDYHAAPGSPGAGPYDTGGQARPESTS